MARYGEACKYALANPLVLHTNYYQDFFFGRIFAILRKNKSWKIKLKKYMLSGLICTG